MTIPKKIREQFGLSPQTEVEFRAAKSSIILRKKPNKLNLKKWRGRSKKSFSQLGYATVDAFIEDIRGR